MEGEERRMVSRQGAKAQRGEKNSSNDFSLRLGAFA
jgi:hypothetical protein